MKKQIIIIGSVFLAAALMFGAYLIFFRDTGTSDESKYYKLSDAALALADLDGGDVVITFADSEAKITGDSYGKYVSGFAETFAHEIKYVTVAYGAGGDYCTVSRGGEKLAYNEADFFNTLESGARYSFNGERIFAYSILKVTGNAGDRTEDEFTLYAMDGYDTDGDTVGTSNRPFVYPNISRSDVQRFTITNQYGKYSVYKSNGSFYFENAELCSYDQEKFASFVVNCTYMLSLGKISNVTDYAKYGLDDESKATGIIEVTTNDGTCHKIIVGSKIASGGGYYVKYYSKPYVYILDSSLDSEVLQPATAMLTANLGYSISSANDTYDISDVLLMYRKADTTIYVKRRVDVVLPKNLGQFNSEQVIGTLIHDKTYFTGAYDDWTSSSVLAGVNSSDGSETYLEFALEKYSLEGKYSVRFGIVRDTGRSAELPTKLVIEAYDNANSKYVEVAEFTDFEQSDKSYRQYEVPFTCDTQLRYVRLRFTLPTGSTYTVFDEITMLADGWDAIPKESVTGIWQIVSPDTYIKPGYNYSTPDPSTFSDILYGMATLTGDSVVEYNVTSSDTLKKYGLDEPDIGLSYDYKGYRSYIYFSEADANGDRYAYATISYDDESGNEVKVTTGIVAKVSRDTASWLGWDPLEFLDRSTFSMYIDKIDTIEMEFDGTTYVFTLEKGDDGKVAHVYCGDTEVDLKNFRYLYVSVLNCSRAGEYTPSEGDAKTQFFRFKMISSVKQTEIIYYRVTTGKLTYETDGEPSNYYVLFSDVNTIINNVKLLLAGKDVPR